MKPLPDVVVVGDSAFMEGIALSLTESHMARVDCLDPEIADIPRYVTGSEPDLIIYELGSPLSVPILALLYDMPGIQLVGIDLDSDSVFVTNSQECVTRSMFELHQVFASVISRIRNPREVRPEPAKRAISAPD